MAASGVSEKVSLTVVWQGPVMDGVGATAKIVNLVFGNAPTQVYVNLPQTACSDARSLPFICRKCVSGNASEENTRDILRTSVDRVSQLTLSLGFLLPTDSQDRQPRERLIESPALPPGLLVADHAYQLQLTSSCSGLSGNLQVQANLVHQQDVRQQDDPIPAEKLAALVNFVLQPAILLFATVGEQLHEQVRQAKSDAFPHEALASLENHLGCSGSPKAERITREIICKTLGNLDPRIVKLQLSLFEQVQTANSLSESGMMSWLSSNLPLLEPVVGHLQTNGQRIIEGALSAYLLAMTTDEDGSIHPALTPFIQQTATTFATTSMSQFHMGVLMLRGLSAASSLQAGVSEAFSDLRDMASLAGEGVRDFGANLGAMTASLIQGNIFGEEAAFSPNGQPGRSQVGLDGSMPDDEATLLARLQSMMGGQGTSHSS